MNEQVAKEILYLFYCFNQTENVTFLSLIKNLMHRLTIDPKYAEGLSSKQKGLVNRILIARGIDPTQNQTNFRSNRDTMLNVMGFNGNVALGQNEVRQLPKEDVLEVEHSNLTLLKSAS